VRGGPVVLLSKGHPSDGPLKHFHGRGEFPLFSPVPASSARRRCLSAAPDNNSGLTSVRRVPFLIASCVVLFLLPFVIFGAAKRISIEKEEPVTYWPVSAANQIELFLSPSSLAFWNTLCESMESRWFLFINNFNGDFHFNPIFQMRGAGKIKLLGLKLFEFHMFLHHSVALELLY
jgi:hypothetical protein